MKTNLLLRNLTSFLTLLALLFSTQVFAQPVNDDCVDALDMAIGADEASCVPVEGTTIDGTPSTEPEFVCSGSWFSDDIWYKFTTPATVAMNGYTVKAEYGSQVGDVPQAGMAIYASCDADEIPSVCFSDDPGRVTLVSNCEFTPNTTYYIRAWSAPGAFDNSGTIRMCVFESEEPLPEESDVVLWGDNPGEGDFDGGVNGWTTINETTCDSFSLWQWHPRGAALGNSCGNAISASPSACNGAMVFSSDAYDNPDGGPCGGGGGECPAAQTGELISPAIDLSGFDVVGVSLKFYQTMRQFQSSYIISYSNDDGATWIDKEINEEIAVNTGTEGFKKVFLADADINATNFRVKFRFEANYYYWIVDDVRIVETEANNLQCAPNNFYAIAPNLMTPVSQVEPFSHLADIYNAGAIEQTNVNLNVTIVDDNTGNEVFTDDLAYLPIPGDSLVENLPMPGYFTPDGSTPSSYTATYEISSDSVDFDPTTNFQTYSFMTSDTVFAKETGATTSFNPAASNWEEEGEPHSAAYGNYFYVVDGDNWHASSVSFSIGNGEDPEMFGRLLSVFLYTWDEDTNEDGNMDPDERTRVAFNIYEIQGTETLSDIITVPLLYFPSNEAGPIDIESNQAYAVMIEYDTNDEVDFLMASSTAVDYAGMIFRSELDGIPEGNGRYAPLVGLNGDLSTEAYGSVGFGRDNVPVVRLNISGIVDTEDQLDALNTIEISPNPTNNKVNVNVELVEVQNEVNIRILDISGRLLVNERYNNFQSQQLEFDVSSFANGTYFLYFISDDGMRTSVLSFNTNLSFY